MTTHIRGLKTEVSMFLCKPTKVFLGLGFQALAQVSRKIYHLRKTRNFKKVEENISLYRLNSFKFFCYAVPQNLLIYLVLVLFQVPDIEIQC
jgi:hypothetical protein